MEEALKNFVQASGILEPGYAHEVIDDEWVGKLASHLVRPVEPEPDSDEPGFALADDTTGFEPYHVDTSVAWEDIQRAIKQDGSTLDAALGAVAYRVIDALFIRIADDLGDKAPTIPGEGRIAVGRAMPMKLLNGLPPLEDANREGREPKPSLLIRMLLMVGRVAD